MTDPSTAPVETVPEESAAELPPPAEPRDGVPAVIESVEALSEYARALAQGTGPVAIDAERASGYRYSQRAYLIQIRREGAGSALIDPIAVPDLSSIQEATAGAEWILHAATQDLGCLAEVGLRPSALFDTELAGRLLGRERVNLGALVLSELGEVLEKGHGAADWSVRPLPAAQLRYAVLDVEFLIELRESLMASLDEANKSEWARQEFEALLSFAPKDRGEDAWRRTSGIHQVRKPRNLAVVRELWTERDHVAARADIAQGRILPDAAIVAAAVAMPKDLDALSGLPAYSGKGQQRRKGTWWAAIERAYALADDQLPVASVPSAGPPPPRSWAERNPDAFARLEAARAIISELSERLTVPAENLMNPELLRRVCWDAPEDVITAFADGGARAWQIDLVATPVTGAWEALP